MAHGGRVVLPQSNPLPYAAPYDDPRRHYILCFRLLPRPAQRTMRTLPPCAMPAPMAAMRPCQGAMVRSLRTPAIVRPRANHHRVVGKPGHVDPRDAPPRAVRYRAGQCCWPWAVVRRHGSSSATSDMEPPATGTGATWCALRCRTSPPSTASPSMSTLGISAKLYTGGGEEMDHSSVLPSQGSFAGTFLLCASYVE